MVCSLALPVCIYHRLLYLPGWKRPFSPSLDTKYLNRNGSKRKVSSSRMTHNTYAKSYRHAHTWSISIDKMGECNNTFEKLADGSN